MRNASTFISKFKATIVAATMAFVGIVASVPMSATAATASSDASNRALQMAEDFGGFLDRANDGVGLSGAKTAKTAFIAANQLGDAEVSSAAGDDWKFSVKVGDYYMDFMSGEVATGGYATGAAIDVFVNNESLFTVQRFDDKISFGFDNYLDLSEASSSTTPFILTGQVSWGVETVCSADIAMASAVFDFIVSENEKSSSQVEPEQDDVIETFFANVTSGNIQYAVANYRNEANNGVTNGWQSFGDAKSMIAESNGDTSWTSGAFTVRIGGQKLTNTGLEQGFVVATNPKTGNLVRFSFTKEGGIEIAEKIGGMYGERFITGSIDNPDRYGVIDLNENEKIDTELLALAAAVNDCCKNTQ